MSTQDNTFIRVTKDTREKLASIGSKRDTYNKIIQRLLEKQGSKNSTNTRTEEKRSASLVV